jgi:urease accessory protein
MGNIHMKRSLALMIVVAALCAGPAMAHTGEDVSGFVSGILHPITGLDHVVAMVAVGLWGGILGKPALWQLPVIFPLVMAVAGAAGALGVPLPGVEVGIALSGIVLGAMVLFMIRPPIAVAAAIVGAFAIFHGHAHGAELPTAANPLAYGAGFVLATGSLHLMGIAFGALIKWPWGQTAVRTAGGAIALAGTAFLTGFA